MAPVAHNPADDSNFELILGDFFPLFEMKLFYRGSSQRMRRRNLSFT